MSDQKPSKKSPGQTIYINSTSYDLLEDIILPHLAKKERKDVLKAHALHTIILFYIDRNNIR